jgi:hypothetical protein
MIKRELHLPPGNLNAYLLRSLSSSTTTKISRSSTPQKEEKMNTVNQSNYRE